MSFTPKQVNNLNDYQQSGVFHPFTCGNEHSGDNVLVATEEGWICNGCDWKQNWAHEFMLNFDINKHKYLAVEND